MDERAFVERLIAHDPPAWDRFMREYGPVVTRAAAAVLARSAVEAEDVAQKVFAALLESDSRLLRSYRGESTLSTWLIGIARHQALMQVRRERARPVPPPRAPIRGPLEELVSAESEDQVVAALEAIPPRDRLLLVLHYRDGLPHAQVAAVVGVAVNSVSPLINRARERLKTALQK